MIALAILAWVFTGLAIAAAVYALLAAYLVGRFMQTTTRGASSFPPVSVLKPLHGLEPQLEANLETFFRQDYPAAFQIVFGVQDSRDEANAVVEKLRARHPAVDVVLVVDGRQYGTNPKVSNLVNMEAAAGHNVIVLSDSDIAVEPDYLRNVVSTLSHDGVGAVTCLYTGWAASGFASRISAMGISYHFLPNVVAGVGLGLAEPCFGSTIAAQKSVLDAIGGFRAFAMQLADDNELGRAVRQLGHQVVIPAFAVRHACTEPSLRAWWDHELRWMRTIRTVDRVGHAGSIVTHAFPLALLGVICSGFGQLALGAALATLAARAMLKWRIDKAFQGPAGPLWLLPVRDVLSFVVFVASLFGASVVWQDAQLRVRQDGALSNR